MARHKAQDIEVNPLYTSSPENCTPSINANFFQGDLEKGNSEERNSLQMRYETGTKEQKEI